MKNWKRILAILLTVLMAVSLLAACAKQETTEKTNEPVAPSEPDTESPEEPAEPDEPEEADEPEEPEEMTDIVVRLWQEGGVTDDGAEKVAAALNEISEREIGVHIDLQFISIGDYGTQINLAVSGGECVDIGCMLPFGPAMFSAVIANGQAMELEGLLQDYGPNIMAEMGDYMDAGTVDGHIYCVPIARAWAANQYFEYDTNYIASLGLTEQLEGAQTWDDFEAVMEAAKNAGDGRYALGGKQWIISGAPLLEDGSFGFKTTEGLSDATYSIYLGDDMKIHRRVDDPQFLETFQMIAGWYEKGYVWPDTAVNVQDTAANICKNDVIWGWFTGSELGAEVTASAQAGRDISVIEVAPGLLNSSAFTHFVPFIPVTSEEPESAMRFLDLLYSNADAMNLLVYGIEGEHYVLGDDGIARCPEGKTTTDCGYHLNEFTAGNAFLLYPWDGQSADFRQLQRDDLANSVVSPVLGFSPDTSKTANETAALSAVYDQYFPAISSGQYTDDLWTQYCDALEAANVQALIDEYQAQLDAWLASK